MALGAQPPGTLPPISIQWPVEASSANSSPSTKYGEIRTTSCRWRAADVRIVEDPEIAGLEAALRPDRFDQIVTVNCILARNTGSP